MAHVLVLPLPSATSTTSTAPDTGLLGKEFELDNGQVVKLVKASGGSLVLTELVQSDISEGNNYGVEPSAASGKACGVAIAACATDSYCFIQVGGVCEAKCGNITVSAGDLIIASASGNTFTSVAATVGSGVIGKALDAGASGAASTVQLFGLR